MSCGAASPRPPCLSSTRPAPRETRGRRQLPSQPPLYLAPPTSLICVSSTAEIMPDTKGGTCVIMSRRTAVMSKVPPTVSQRLVVHQSGMAFWSKRRGNRLLQPSGAHSSVPLFQAPPASMIQTMDSPPALIDGWQQRVLTPQHNQPTSPSSFIITIGCLAHSSKDPAMKRRQIVSGHAARRSTGTHRATQRIGQPAKTERLVTREMRRVRVLSNARNLHGFGLLQICLKRVCKLDITSIN